MCGGLNFVNFTINISSKEVLWVHIFFGLHSLTFAFVFKKDIFMSTRPQVSCIQLLACLSCKEVTYSVGNFRNTEIQYKVLLDI